MKYLNIVGFCVILGSVDGDFCFVMEDCERVFEDIIEEKVYLEEDFMYDEMLKVFWFVINVLSYIYNEKKIFYGDIKSGNVFIRGDFEVVKLCDFGVVLWLNDDLSGLKNFGGRYIGIELWKCKEVLKGGVIIDKVDIFVYGLLIWEMLVLNVFYVDLFVG